MNIILIIAVLGLGIALIFSLLQQSRLRQEKELLERNAPLDEVTLDFNAEAPSSPAEEETPALEKEIAFLIDETAVLEDTSPALEDETIAVEEEASALNEETPVQGEETPVQDEDEELTAVIRAASTTPTVALGGDDSIEEPKSWTDSLILIRKNRELDEFDTAIALCVPFLPKPQAFKQLLMTQRANMKKLMSDKQDATMALHKLYDTAVLAELYRHSEELPSFALTSEHACTMLRIIEPDYNRQGYTDLPGLNKSDITLLVNLWGEPLKHQHPIQTFQEGWWEQRAARDE